MILATLPVAVPLSIEPGEYVEHCYLPRPWLESAAINTKIFGGRLPLNGPWWDEPDESRWIDPSTGYHCLIRRNHHGVLNGYVRVPESHHLYGKTYDDGPDTYIDVHGCITWSGPISKWVPGIVGDDWWFGFDTGHAFDLQPGMTSVVDPYHDSVYRDLGYVKAETASLAAQLRVLQE